MESNNMQSQVLDGSATINGGSDSMRLSSDSIDNEKENVSKFMNYENGYFSYIRLGQEGTCRYYENIDSAYHYALRECETRLKQGIYGSRMSFIVTGPDHAPIFNGEPKRNGKIKFSIYNGNGTSYLATITDEHNKSFFQTNINAMKHTEITTSNRTITTNKVSFTNSEDADLINFNASIFIDKNILTEDNVKFLCLSKESAQNMAKIVQETAIAYKDADNETFMKAIHKVSKRMITVTKRLASGKSTDETHCSMHDDLLYCAAHCKLHDSLFDGSNTWRKTPGKLNYNKLEDAIIDMYDRGQKMLLEVSEKKSKKMTDETTHTKREITIINDYGHQTFNDIVQAVTSTIMTYAKPSEDTLFYLNMKGSTLDSEVKSLTNNVVTVTQNNNLMIFKTISDTSEELNVSDYTDNDTLRKEVRATIAKLIICAALSDKTRQLISSVVDLTSIETFVSSSFKMAA